MQIGIERVGAYDLHCAEERRPAGCKAWGIPRSGIEGRSLRQDMRARPGQRKNKLDS
jgi:hypothetical protein